MWCEKDLAAKRKLRYYKEVINPTLEYQKYLSVLTSSKKKINIAKIKTNSHELHSETGCWTVPKTPWMERILCCNTDLPSLLRCQNYSEIGRLLSKLFEHKNEILNQTK